MPKVRRGRSAALFRGRSLLIFVFAAWAFYLSSYQVFLRLENYETHAPLFWVRVKANDTFSLAFKHSYDKAMYIEHYRVVHGKAFVLTGITFKSDLNGQGFVFKNPKYLANGWGTLQNLRERMGVIPFMMGSPDEANHTLIIHGKRYLLTRFVHPGTPVASRVVRVRRFYSYLWEVKKWIK